MTRVLIEISLADQCLRWSAPGAGAKDYPVSTAANGPGEMHGSGCTPRGWHRVRARIGQDAPPGSVFIARRPTGEIFDASLARREPDRDWILTRILWLSGEEPGRNRLGQVDSMRRFIYIHGCPDSEPMGVPRSAGCIRMHDDAILDLFERTPVGSRVHIREDALPNGREWTRATGISNRCDDDGPITTDFGAGGD